MSSTCDWCEGAGCDTCTGQDMNDGPAAADGQAETCPWCSGEGCESCNYTGVVTAAPAGNNADWGALDGAAEWPQDGSAPADADASADAEAGDGARLTAPQLCNIFYAAEYDADEAKLAAVRKVIAFAAADPSIIAGNYEAATVRTKSLCACAQLSAKLGEPWSAVEPAFAALMAALGDMTRDEGRINIVRFLDAAAAPTAAADVAAAAPAAVLAALERVGSMWSMLFDLRMQDASKQLDAIDAAAENGLALTTTGGTAAATAADASSRASAVLAALKRMCATDSEQSSTAESAWTPAPNATDEWYIARALALGRGEQILQVLCLDAQRAYRAGDSFGVRVLHALIQRHLTHTVTDPRTTAALQETWGKAHADADNWTEAYSAFFQALTAAQEAGASDAGKRALGYAALASLMCFSKVCPLQSSAARVYDSSPSSLLTGVGELRKASDALDMPRFRDAQRVLVHLAAATKDGWLRRHAERAGDMFRRKLIESLCGPYRRVDIATFAARVGSDAATVRTLAAEMIMDGSLAASLDAVAGTLILDAPLSGAAAVGGASSALLLSQTQPLFDALCARQAAVGDAATAAISKMHPFVASLPSSKHAAAAAGGGIGPFGGGHGGGSGDGGSFYGGLVSMMGRGVGRV